MQGSDLREWARGAEINRDRNLRLQYLAGMALNTYEPGPIYDEMLRPAVFPENLFVGAPESVAKLRGLFHRRRY